MSVLAARAFSGAAWTAAGTGFQLVLTLATLAITARVLGPAAYGLYGAALLVLGLAELFVRSAMTEALVQRRDLAAGHIDATFWLQAALSAILALGIALVSPWLASLTGLAAAGPILAVMSLCLPLTALAAVPAALLERELRFADLNLASAAGGLAASAVGITAALAGAGVWALVMMEVSRRAVGLAICFGRSGYRPGRAGRLCHLADLSLFNLSTLALHLVSYADRALPRLIVAHSLGPAALGGLVLIQRLIDQLTQLTTGPLGAVAMATVSRLSDDRPAIARFVTLLFRASAALTLPLFVGLAACAPLALPLVLGETWRSFVLPAQILLLVGLRTATGAYTAALLRGVGRTGQPIVITAVGALLGAGLALLAAPFGLAAIALAGLLRAYLLWPWAAMSVASATGVGVKDQLAATMPALVASAVMGGAVLAASQVLAGAEPLVALLTLILLGAATYLAVLALGAPKDLAEGWAWLRGAIRRSNMRPA